MLARPLRERLTQYLGEKCEPLRLKKFNECGVPIKAEYKTDGSCLYHPTQDAWNAEHQGLPNIGSHLLLNLVVKTDLEESGDPYLENLAYYARHLCGIGDAILKPHLHPAFLMVVEGPTLSIHGSST